MAMDLVSGAEVPAEEIAVTPAMIEAGYRAYRAIVQGEATAGDVGSFDYWKARRYTQIYIAMERARRAESARETCGDVFVQLEDPISGLWVKLSRETGQNRSAPQFQKVPRRAGVREAFVPCWLPQRL